MLNQMKNVRTMPTSASGANSQGSKEQSADDNIFDSLKGVDGDLDNLFGQAQQKSLAAFAFSERK